jgi:hypothetical protein
MVAPPLSPGPGPSPHSEVCLECDPETYLVEGKCKGKLFCTGSSFAEAGYGECNCNRWLETGNKDETCGRCNIRKSPSSKDKLFANQLEWNQTRKGEVVYKTCVECTEGTYFYQGECVRAGDCPLQLTSYFIPTAQYSFGKRKNSCDEPFLCVNRYRVWSSENSEREEPAKCKCPNKNCAECAFATGKPSSTNCIKCKRKTYLLNGDCVDALACVAAGRVPLQPESGGPRGWVCV